MKGLLLLLLLSLVCMAVEIRNKEERSSEFVISRGDFPLKFFFGSGTSAYQYEGAVAEDGRTPSVWDTFCYSGKVVDKSTGDIASDGYHKYKEDVKLMAETGLEAHRFSISWTRILPDGRGSVNPLGLRHYNDFIDELISHGITPHVTLFHFDLPQVLEDEYGGWLSPKIVDDFAAFADVCFKEFGDRVKYWTTLNEPNDLALEGYDTGLLPPQRCSFPFGKNCSVGNSIVEPYIVAHNCLLAHAAAASLYKTKYQAKQHGQIGLNFFAYNLVPLTNSTRDRMAAQRARDFYIGWIIEPLLYGDYPNIMKKNAGMKLPSFSGQQRKQVMNSFDFLGVNHYKTFWVKDKANDGSPHERDFMGDSSTELVEKTATLANKYNSFGLRRTLEYLKQVYGNPPVIVHENGYRIAHSYRPLDDTPRVQYLSAFIGSLLDALRNRSNVIGYFTWSFLDVFELTGGHESSFGLYYVDFEDKNLRRVPKLSAHWYSTFLKGKGNAINNNNVPSHPSHASI